MLYFETLVLERFSVAEMTFKVAQGHRRFNRSYITSYVFHNNGEFLVLF